MATAAYKNALEMAASLSHEEQVQLVRELATRVVTDSEPKSQRSILELRGLGKDIWQGIDAQEYIRSERSSWNG